MELTEPVRIENSDGTERERVEPGGIGVRLAFRAGQEDAEECRGGPK